MSMISDRAIMVSLSIREWTGQAADRHLSHQAEVGANAENGTLTVIKELTPRHFLKPIKTAERIARQEHLRMTVPGLHRGQHLLATAMFMEYTNIMGNLRDNFNSCVRDFITHYPDIISKAPARLGDAYRESDFPSVGDMQRYFDFDLQFSPVPKVNDWRLDDLSQSDIEEIRSSCQSEVEDMFKEATMEIFQRAKDVLERFLVQAASEDANIRKPTIDNIRDMAHLVLRMNITKDPELERLGYEMMEHFDTNSAEDIRNDGDLRKKLAEAAKTLVGRIPKH